MSVRLQSLRQGVWTGNAADPKEVGEALRDLYSWLSQLKICDVVPVTGAVWSEPFSIAVALRPQIVVLSDARLAGTLEAVDAGAIQWESSADNRVSIARARSLQPSVSYDLKFLVVY